MSVPGPTRCGSLESPGLAGAAARTSPLGSAFGGSFITMRVPQSICSGGRAQIPHRKLCNSRSGGENPPNPEKSWSVYFFSSYARVGSPICGLSAQSLSQSLSLCSPKAVFAQEAAPECFAQGQECQKHSQDLRSPRDKGSRAGVTHGGEFGPYSVVKCHHRSPLCSWARGFPLEKGN